MLLLYHANTNLPYVLSLKDTAIPYLVIQAHCWLTYTVAPECCAVKCVPHTTAALVMGHLVHQVLNRTVAQMLCMGHTHTRYLGWNTTHYDSSVSETKCGRVGWTGQQNDMDWKAKKLGERLVIVIAYTYLYTWKPKLFLSMDLCTHVRTYMIKLVLSPKLERLNSFAQICGPQWR